MLMKWSELSYFLLALVSFCMKYPIICCEETFGTRTRYGPVFSFKNIELLECEAQQLWVLSRAGSSWPPETSFQSQRFSRLRDLSGDVVSNYMEGRGTLQKEVIERFKTLNFPPQEVVAGTMTDQGKVHFRDLAHMLKDTMPHLLSKPYSSKDYEIRYIDTISSNQSMESFTKAIFGDEFDTSAIHKPAELDTFLDAPNICELWKKEIYTVKGYWGIITASLTSPVSRLTREVSKRLGFKNNLDKETVIMMYVGCGLQVATGEAAQATWCAAFSPENLRLLEYLEDRFYYKACTGGGNRILKDLDKNMPCRLYEELIKELSRVEHSRLHPSGIFYFTDEKTLLLLLNGLGFLKYTTINDFESADGRTFRTSKLVPFGANLCIVIYRCTAKEELKVAFILNGNMLKLPGQENSLIPLKQLKNDLQTYALTQCRATFCRDIDKTKEDILSVFLSY